MENNIINFLELSSKLEDKKLNSSIINGIDGIQVLSSIHSYISSKLKLTGDEIITKKPFQLELYGYPNIQLENSMNSLFLKDIELSSLYCDGNLLWKKVAKSPYIWSIKRDGKWIEMQSFDDCILSAIDGDTISYAPQTKTPLVVEHGYRIRNTLTVDFNNNEIMMDYQKYSSSNLSAPEGCIFLVGILESDLSSQECHVSAIPSITLKNMTLVLTNKEGQLYGQNGGGITNAEFGVKEGNVYAELSALTLDNVNCTNFNYGLKLIGGPTLSSDVRLSVWDCSFTNNKIAGIRADIITDSNFTNCVIKDNGDPLTSTLDYRNIGTEAGRSTCGINIENQYGLSSKNISFNNCQFIENGNLAYKLPGNIYPIGSNFLIGSTDVNTILSGISFKDCVFKQCVTSVDNDHSNVGLVGYYEGSVYPTDITFDNCSCYQADGSIGGYFIDERALTSRIANKLSAFNNDMHSLSCYDIMSNTRYELSDRYDIPDIDPIPVDVSSILLCSHIDFVKDPTGTMSSEISVLSTSIFEYNDEYADIVGPFKSKHNLDIAYCVSPISKENLDKLHETYQKYGKQLYDIQCEKTLQYLANYVTDGVLDWHLDLECMFNNNVKTNWFTFIGRAGRWDQTFSLNESEISVIPELDYEPYKQHTFRIFNDIGNSYTRDVVPKDGQYHPSFGTRFTYSTAASMMTLLIGIRKESDLINNKDLSIDVNIYQTIPPNKAALSSYLGYGTSNGEIWDRWLGYWERATGRPECMKGYDPRFHNAGKMTTGHVEYRF